MGTGAVNKSASGGGYEVARPRGQCCVTGRVIAPGEKFMAALRETPMGFERVDVSLDAWPTFERKDVLGFWQAVMPQPEQKKKMFVDDEVLCNLFERLADVTEANKLNFRFVLGLILMRKRMVVYEGTRRDGEKDFWVVRMRGREEKMDLLDPKLDEQHVADVSHQLTEILNEEL